MFGNLRPIAQRRDPNRVSMVATMLLTFSLLVCAATVAVFYASGARTRAAHLGSMSVSWLAERRTSSRS